MERLSRNLREEFPGASVFSTPSMRQMYLEYRDYPNLLQLVREIPWGQNISIMTRAKDIHEPAELVDKLPKPEDLEEQIMRELGKGELEEKGE